MIKLRPIRKKAVGNGTSVIELDVVSEVLVVTEVLVPAELVEFVVPEVLEA